MPNTRISDDADAGTLDGSELIPIVKAGLNKSTTPYRLASAMSGGVVSILAVPLALVLAGTDDAEDVLVIQTAAFEAALATYSEIILPDPPAPYVRYTITDDIDFPSYCRLSGNGKPHFKKTTGNGQYLQAVSQTDIEISGIYFEGNAGELSSANVALFTNCANVRVRDCDFSETEGSFVFNGTSHDCYLERFSFSDGASTAVECSGSATRIHIRQGRFEDNVGFGVWLTGTTSDCVVDDLSCDSNGLELVGITYLSHGHKGNALTARGTGDNGISVTGYDCLFTNIECSANDKHGICFYGHRNTLVGFNLFNNGQLYGTDSLHYAGLCFTPGFGGIGQHNTAASGRITDDQTSKTQYHCIKHNTNGYTLWAAGQSITPIGTFRYYSLNLYASANTGTTGATPPTHTTGTVSDGTVNWTFVRAFETAGNTTTVEALHNNVVDVEIGLSIGATIGDLTATRDNPVQNGNPAKAYVAGLHYACAYPGATGSTITPAVDTIYFVPFQVDVDVDIASLKLWMITGQAGSTAKAAIYKNNPVTNRPHGAPVIVDNTGVATTTTGAFVTLSATGQLKRRNTYWAAVKVAASGTLPTFMSYPSSHLGAGVNMGLVTAASNAFSVAHAYATNFLTIPDNQSFTAVNSSGVPLLWFVPS